MSDFNILKNENNINGLILTGGQSSRMGEDKSLLMYHDLPQREYLFKLMQKFCVKVFTSCRNDQNVPSALNPIVDHYNFTGPLNGILSAITLDPEKGWLIIAVDMPYVDESALQLLITNRDETKVATCFYNKAEKFPEPLLTLWESAAYPLLLNFVKERNTSPRHFLNTHPVKLIDSPNEQILLNVNYPYEKPSMF